MVFPGIQYTSLSTLLIAAAVWGFLNLLILPVLKLITLPLNLITFGLFSIFLSAFILFLVTQLVPGFSVTSFETTGFILGPLNVPSFHFSTLFAYVVISLSIGLVNGVLPFFLS